MKTNQRNPLSKLIGSFRDFHKNYFNPVQYVAVGLFIATLIGFNYALDFEDVYIDGFRGSLWRVVLFFVYHGFAWYGVVLIMLYTGKLEIKKIRLFWVKSLLGIFILSIDRSVLPFISEPLLDQVAPQVYRFCHKLLNNSYGWITIAFTLWIVKLIFDKKDDTGLYGLRFRHADIRLYIILLLLMAPIVYLGSFMEQFMDYYPLYKRSGGSHFSVYYNLPEWKTKLLYEFFYISDFLNTELLFRGFLVIGLSKIMGKNVILPMVATYAVLHFGKPMGEAISSVFGGYILGIIALYSRNIWGGVFLHGGVALLMEVFAFWRQ